MPAVSSVAGTTTASSTAITGAAAEAKVVADENGVPEKATRKKRIALIESFIIIVVLDPVDTFGCGAVWFNAQVESADGVCVDDDLCVASLVIVRPSTKKNDAFPIGELYLTINRDTTGR
jgi:hypothetical protein